MTGRRGGATLEIARSGALSVLLHPLWSSTAVACLVAMLAPLIAGLALSRGIADEAAAALAGGADLAVTGVRYGRAASLPVAAAGVIRAVPGVASVEPRIVGPVRLGAAGEPVVLVGVAAERLDAGLSGVLCSEGRLPRPGTAEVAVGSVLAARLGLRAGSVIPPFYRNDAGERLTTVVGVFRSDLPMWQAHAMLAPLEHAQAVFEETGTATSLLVRCEPSYREPLREVLSRIPSLAPEGAPPVRPRVVSRDDVESILATRMQGREATLVLVLLAAFAVGVPLLLSSTGIGLSERRRETGLLAALGWRTEEIVLRSLVESVVVAVLGWSLAVLAAWAWLRFLGGAGLADAFVPGTGPDLPPPYRLAPEAAAAAALVAAVVTSAGTLLTSWRVSSAPPTEAMR